MILPTGEPVPTDPRKHREVSDKGFAFPGSPGYLVNFTFLLFSILMATLLFASCGSRGGEGKNQLSSPERITWVWEDSFTNAQQGMLVQWIDEVFSTTDSLLGPFPFDVSVHFYKRVQAGEPVPWAHTRRSGEQSLHFHVDPSFSLEAFREDWTAPHEISHLALPFLGRSQSWFSEGFATYMQNQVMQAMGTMTDQEVTEKLREKLAYNQQFFKGKKEPFITVCRDLVKKDHNYPAMYWGSTSFFLRMDQALQKEKGMNFKQFIQWYQKQGRMADENLDMMIDSWDVLLGETFCRELLRFYREEPAYLVFEELRVRG